jgi:hypothetical protein
VALHFFTGEHSVILHLGPKRLTKSHIAGICPEPAKPAEIGRIPVQELSANDVHQSWQRLRRCPKLERQQSQ